MGYRTASNDEIEVRVDLESPSSPIQYRVLDDEKWHSTPFQRADARFEDDALALVEAWLEDSAAN